MENSSGETSKGARSNSESSKKITKKKILRNSSKKDMETSDDCDQKSSKQTKKKKDTAKTKAKKSIYAEAEREQIKSLITGAIFKTDVDNTHPLGFGYNKDYFTLKLGTNSYDFLKRGSNVVTLDDNTIISGFAGSKTLAKQKGSLIFGTENIGSGKIIYLIDNPLFRGFWDNGKLFFSNALFMVK